MSELISVGQLYTGSIRHPHTKRTELLPKNNESSFQEVLQSQMVHFSHHAEQRLQQRGIEFQPEQLAKIHAAIDHAASKGAKDSLMLINDTALIVNIKNRTVVTAMDEASMKNNLFTKIDSAVIIT
ncbi:TIGR02530 family flagellar biosynthesis protein [Paenibacillus agricola]|jgi:flagellar operon protein|uniref:Flagellar biosynthesis protein n=1 Tax=Paenibacillus agricola TaxID=2716264 RepID=A0ABX0J0S4_9BACL|nr:TIGR02530 family flagellar biosynthesis protein [Paenibacillus agricola]NHN28378.1 flagellar biosynthesis protein [Paenibacillus agricola]